MRRIVLRTLLLAGLVVFAALAFLAWQARPAAPVPFYSQFDAFPLVIAHQGGDGLRPGDTLIAMRHAASLGVDMLEMDVHQTRDGHIVLMHDETVDRTTDGTGYIKDKTLAELQALDAGYTWSPDGRSYPFREQGVTAPALEAVFQEFPDWPMNIEIKQTDPPMAAALCSMIRRFDRAERTLVASFDAATIEAFRQACPEVATSLAEDEARDLVILNLVFLSSIYRPPAQAVQVPEARSGIHILTPRFVQAAQARGLAVDAWTINESPDMTRMIELGVDGIITDYPDLLLALLNR